MITTDQKQTFTDYVILQVIRQILPIALDATENDECRRHAGKLRKLRTNAKPVVVMRACEGAYIAARAAYNVDRDGQGDNFVDSSIAAGAVYSAIEAYNDGSGDHADAYHYVANIPGSAGVYAAILIEAAKRLPAGAVPSIPDLHKDIYAAVTLPGHGLELCSWHTCATVHCRAGWAVVLGGAAGKELEKAFGPAVAGGLIYACNTGVVPNFHEFSTSVAMADMKWMAEAS